MEIIAAETHSYLRAKKKFPNVWCAGCGIGIALGAIIRAIDNLKLDRNDVAMVSGIGCSSRMPVYVDFNTLHTTHGRALAFATGVKLAKPEAEGHSDNRRWGCAGYRRKPFHPRLQTEYRHHHHSYK